MIQKYNKDFGLRWLLRKFNICPNAYYNYLKNRKADYHQQKDEIKNSIREIYHSHGGVNDYRTVHAYLVRKGYAISHLTVHKYMNTEMQLFSISRKKKSAYEQRAKILAGTSFFLPSSVLKINGSIFVWLSSAKMGDTQQITSMLPKINPN